MKGGLLTRRELAEKLNVTPRTITKWWAQRILPKTVLSNRICGTRPIDLEKAFEKRTQQAV